MPPSWGVQTDPQQLTEGDNVTLQCEVSHHLPDTQLYWINRETQENFPNPHQLRNVNMGQRDWTYAVFTGSTLKALIPLTLNISITKTSPPPTSPDSHTNTDPSPLHRDFTLISVCTVLSFLLLVLIGAVFWRMKTKEAPADVGFAECSPISGCERFSRLFGLQSWLCGWSAINGLGFVDNWSSFWEQPALYRRDGLHPSCLGSRILSRNIESAVQTCKLEAMEAATYSTTTDLEEYTSSVTSYIGKCIDDVTMM
ncbi:hypothetical protein NFI96_007117 [Prochilodus magdalenae]|nr:hypothetical protein NFI96_007117 [Prochilodus magdalenae]